STRYTLASSRSEASAAGSYTVRFIMPAEWTMDTLPAPANRDVRLVPVPGRTLAAYRYTGGDSEEKREKAGATLRAFTEAVGYRVTGPPEWAGYDAPFVPFFLRRYEIMLPVAPANKE
ncbi:MAG: heme-binding protein, partial [Hyphomonas sp.]